MTLGQRIQTLRKENKLSQEYIADSLNVSRQAVSKWENDLSAPDTENLIALARLLDTDVAYLATGELTEDMEPEPLPEPEAPPKPAKRPGKGRWLIPALLAVSFIANILLLCLWRYEKSSEAKLEQLCVSCVYSAKEHFADYASYGSDAAYWSGVADFRGYMQSYLLLYGSGGDYMECNELYGNLLYEKERVSLYLEELRKTMRLLYENIDGANAFLKMDRLNNLIQYGE